MVAGVLGFCVLKFLVVYRLYGSCGLRAVQTTVVSSALSSAKKIV